jgi:uncharacterized membrane protein
MAAFLGWAWPQLPERVAVHWGPSFQVNGWGSRWSLAVLPGVALGMRLLLPLLARLDVGRAGYAHWQPTFWITVNLVVLFMAALEVAMVGFNLGWPVNMRRVILGLLGLLFVGVGNYLPRTRPNRWIGIRTPWTLASDSVWRETHREGGRAFVFGGLVVLAAAFAPGRLIPWVTLAGVAVGLAIPVVYSWVLWRREQEGRGET